MSNVIVNRRDYERLYDFIMSPIANVYGPMTRLDTELRKSRIVAPVNVPRNVVTMNSQVRVEDLATGETHTYTLAFPEQANIDEDRISVAAPLGAALLGAKQGEVVEFAGPRGTRRVKIRKILYQPEAAGDFHL